MFLNFYAVAKVESKNTLSKNDNVLYFSFEFISRDIVTGLIVIWSLLKAADVVNNVYYTFIVHCMNHTSND